MSQNRTTKEKVGAIVFVLFLFFLVSLLFGYIAIINKGITTELRSKVRAAKIEAETRALLGKMTVTDLDSKQILAKSFLTVGVTQSGIKKVLAERNSNDTLPIASVTKLMTAIIVLENIDLKTKVTATTDYIGGDGTAHVLQVGQTYLASELLKNMLISSDNDSARLLSSILGTKKFVDLMNKKAKELSLIRTSFVNVTGLDPLEGEVGFNISSATDLAELLLYINKNQPDIFKITDDPNYNFCDTENSCKIVVSTDQLLTDQSFKFKILGGKTGQTVLANKNLALLLAPYDNIYLINIVLNSQDSFADTKNLINQIKFK